MRSPSSSRAEALGPRGVGRGYYFSGGIGNPLTDVPDVLQGTLLDLPNPTLFSGATSLQVLPTIRSDFAQARSDPNNRDLSVTNIEADKQGSVVATDLPSPSATHVNLEVQREIVRDLVVSADFFVRQFSHIGTPPGFIDVNDFSSARRPILPICSDAQASDPKALCSLGPISLTSGIGSGRYMGLLVRAEKRLSRGWQSLASYAYSSSVGDNFGSGFNNDSPLDNYGPRDRDVRHILTLPDLYNCPSAFRWDSSSPITASRHSPPSSAAWT